MTSAMRMGTRKLRRSDWEKVSSDMGIKDSSDRWLLRADCSGLVVDDGWESVLMHQIFIHKDRDECGGRNGDQRTDDSGEIDSGDQRDQDREAHQVHAAAHNARRPAR